MALKDSLIAGTFDCFTHNSLNRKTNGLPHSWKNFFANLSLRILTLPIQYHFWCFRIYFERCGGATSLPVNQAIE